MAVEMSKTAKQVADTIAALRFVHSADVSPDGRQVAWCLSRIVGDDECVDLHLATIDPASVGGDVVETLPFMSSGRSTAPEFSPDGRHLAFLHDGPASDGSSGDRGQQIVVLDLASLSTRTVTSLPQGVASRPRWSPDGRTIAFTAGSAPVDRSLPYRVTRNVGWMDGIGLVDDAVNDIHVVDVDTLELIRLTDDGSLLGNPEWHADCHQLTYVAIAAAGEWRLEGRIRTVDLAGNATTVAALADVFSVAVHPDFIVGTSTGSAAKGDDPHGHLFTVAADGSCTERSGELDVNGDVIPDLPVPFTDPVPILLLHGDSALVRVQVRDRLEIHRVGLHGATSTQVALATSGCVYPLAIRGEHLLYAEGERLRAPDLHVRNLATGHDVRVSDTASFNDAFLTPLRVEHLTAYAEQGPAVQTTFLAPAGTNGPLPTVMLMHGGPETAFGEAMFLDAHALCEAGLGVLLVNARGSRGYGRDFVTAPRGDWGGIDAADFIAAVDLAIERRLADPERLGVAGLSYGGFMSTWLIGQTDRFKAAVAENPVTNFVSFYGTSDVGLSFGPRIMGGPIETNVEQYVASSPVTFAENVTTPTLLIVSDHDRRCPPEQALQFYSRLRRAGCVAELLIMPGASHDSAVNGSPVVRRAQNEALVDWMTTHLLGGAGHLLGGAGHLLGGAGQ